MAALKVILHDINFYRKYVTDFYGSQIITIKN